MNKVIYCLKLFMAGLIGWLLVGCGVSNNVTFNTTNGNCANGTTGNPYCMSVQIVNNGGGGQNFITSTNFPISAISYTITGVANLQYPGQNNAMDPNNCGGSTIKPGGTCTFYLQLTGEAFPVTQQESVQVSINYTVNNTLFGGSSTTNSANTTIYELTSLYTIQNNGNLTIYNSAWNNFGLIESKDTANSLAIDTSSYGLLYIGGGLGLYAYAASNNTITSSLSPTSSFSGSNNLLISGGNLLAANLNSAGGIYSYNLAGESWNISNPVYTIAGPFTNNSSAITPNNVLYLTPLNSINIYACSTASGSGFCPNEGVSGIPTTGGNIINTMAYSTKASSSAMTGLYAGTVAGLYFESGTVSPNPNATWGAVSGESTGSITTMLNVTLAGATTSTVYAGDSLGNIWQIPSTNPESATLSSFPNLGSSINAMTADIFGSVLYVSTGTSIWSCPFGGTCTSILPLSSLSPYGGTTNAVGMVIGSQLTNTLNNPANNGNL